MSRAFLQRLKTGREKRLFPRQNEGKLADFYAIETHNELGKYQLCPPTYSPRPRPRLRLLLFV